VYCQSTSKLTAQSNISSLQVLEHSVNEGEAQCKALQRDTLAAADAERIARQALAAAHEQAGLAERALQQQTRRLHTLEGMRLQDITVSARRSRMGSLIACMHD